MQLVLIRHLPTRYNKAHRLQGTRDIPILKPDDAALKTIAHNREALTGIGDFDSVLVSELSRTRQTAHCYEMDAMARVERLVNELDFGSFEGRPKREFIEQHGEAWLEAPQTLVLGESVANLQRRIESFIDKYARMDRVLVFGHGAWIRACIALVREGDLRSMNKTQVQNNELVVLRVT